MKDRKPNNYWTFEKLKEEALKFERRVDFQKMNNSAYTIAYKQNILDEICEHMIKIGNKNKRCIYVAIFSDKCAYVGLTYNFTKRKNTHLYSNKYSSVKNHIIKTKLIPHFIKLTDYIDSNISSIKEGEYLNMMTNRGYTLLNKTKTGGLGGSTLIWTFDKCKEEVYKYKDIKTLRRDNNSVYSTIIKNKWGIELFKHMISLRKPNGYWTKEKCIEESLKFKTKKEFMSKSPTVYSIIQKRGWINDVLNKMMSIKRKNGYWTKEKCKEQSLKYKTRKEYQVKSRSSYNSAWKNKWLDEICIHMK